MSTAQNQLQKWLTSQEPTKEFFSKKKYIIKDYLSEADKSQIEKNIKLHFSDRDQSIHDLVSDVFKNLHPFIIFTQGQFQAINDEVFTINHIPFTGSGICKQLRQSEYVFPNIVSTGPEIENYALVHTDSLHRSIIRTISRQTNAIGQSLLVEKLLNEYNIKKILPLFPGEPGWKIQEGMRIFDLFESLPKDLGISVTKRGTPNVANTSYGLLIAN